jgi:3,4-dihydroxy 2-butanone 4-phosphate synthase/GTP cyclohydrolase II
MFNSIEEVVDDLKKGRMVVVVDDEDRENEGDHGYGRFFYQGQRHNFMARFGGG